MSFKKINLAPLILGLLVSLLGGLVLYGWHINNTDLIQIRADYAPMQYNTALGFLLCGIGLILMCFGKRLSAACIGIATTLIGFLTLIQYLFNFDFGIDELLMDHGGLMTKTSHPGRMAPSTALCFSLSGLLLLFNASKKSLLIGVGALILNIAVLSIVGYFVNEEAAYGWGDLTRMAIHTTAGFIMLGTGFVIVNLFTDERQRGQWLHSVPVIIFTTMVVITAFVSYNLSGTAREEQLNHFESLVFETQHTLDTRYARYETSLKGGLGLFYASNSVERDEWEQYVAALDINETLPGINGIGYVDYVTTDNLDAYLEETRTDGVPGFINHPVTDYFDKFIIKFIEPVLINEAAIGLDIGFENNRREAAEKARDTGEPALTKKIQLVQDQKKQPGFLLLLPFYKSKSVPATVTQRRALLNGWVYAPFIGANFLKDLINISKGQIAYEVYNGMTAEKDALIYKSHDGFFQDANIKPALSMQTTVEFGGQPWVIIWYSSDIFNAPVNHSISKVSLLVGLLFALLLYYITSHLIHGREVIAAEVIKRTQELAESEQDLKEVYEFQDLVSNHIPDLIFVKNTAFEIVQGNQAFMNLYPEDVPLR